MRTSLVFICTVLTLLMCNFAQDLRAEILPVEQEGAVVNVYSSRKETLTQPLFDEFTAQTGITIRFISDKAGKLISRLKQEGENTPADVFLTSDVANLGYAKSLGLLTPAEPDILHKNIPVEYRDPEGYWFGLTLRARALFYAKDRVKESDLSSYEDLADPYWKGKVLIRSSSNVYNQSLISSMIEAHGKEYTENWAKGLVANFARTPQGGDTDQIKAVAAGEGDIAVANTYYYGRLQASEKPEDQAVVEKVGIFFPNQDGRGAHVNVSGGGIVKYAKHKANAQRLLEFLSNAKAQHIYAEANHEYPVMQGIPASDVADSWGAFKKDALPLASLANYRSDVLKIADRVGWR